MATSGLLTELTFAGHLRDTSGNARKPAATGQPRFGQGPDGPCAAFKGDWWLEMPLPAGTLGQTFTVECLVQPLRPAHGENPTSWGAVWRIAGLAVFDSIVLLKSSRFMRWP